MSDTKNPPWTHDEIVLALELYRDSWPKVLDKNSAEVVKLSNLLRELKVKLDGEVSSTYRNPNGVGMKMQNFNHFNPDFYGAGLKGGSKLDQKLLLQYWTDEESLRKRSTKIREILDGKIPITEFDEEEDANIEGEEGRILVRLHRSRERNKKIVLRKKNKVLKMKGVLECESCNFDFEKIYGERGKGYIECHHIKPLSEIETKQKTNLDDLALVCSNCHRMIHKSKPWLSIAELRGIIKN